MANIRRVNKGRGAESAPELRSDGWDRFRTAVKAAAKAGPQHRLPGPALLHQVSILKVVLDVPALVEMVYCSLDQGPQYVGFLCPEHP